MGKKWMSLVAVLLTILLLLGTAVAEEDLQKVSTFADLKKYLEEGTSVELAADIVATGSIDINGDTVVMDLNGHELKFDCENKGNYLFYVVSNGSLQPTSAV